MEPLEIVFISLAIAIFIAIIISVICGKIFQKRVIKNSKLYNGLLEINKLYNFNSLKRHLKYCHVCNSKRQLDNYDFEKAFRYIVSQNIDYFRKLLNYVEENLQLMANYRYDCSKLLKENTPTKQSIKPYKVPYKTWKSIEEKLYNKNLLTATTEFDVYIRATYTSPQGRNSYHNDCRFFQENVERLINTIDCETRQALEKERYEQEKRAERERQKALRPTQQIERNKLTKKLRYEILERDHYKCVVCGRSAEDGVVLHVDHIIPISKGGLTVPENLRTLCADCNLGKSDILPKAN